MNPDAAALRQPARAKVNLHLRITGRRADGYHLLDSLAVFAGAADTLEAAPSQTLHLALDGPEAASLAAEPDNLVLRAARLLAAATGRPAQAALRLTKMLPVASGLGGGSADAAAALRALDALWGSGLDAAALGALALRLGADVPVCLASRPARMQGIGELVTAVPPLPDFGLLLANPRQAVATAAVFAARRGGFSAPVEMPARFAGLDDFAAWLRPLGNDLEAAAIALCPPIAEVLAAIAAQPGCLLARMSGSGATCFGLFAGRAAAEAAAARLPPGWWRWAGGTADREAPDPGGTANPLYRPSQAASRRGASAIPASGPQ